MIKSKLKTNTGYSLLETVFYISFFAIFSILVINTLITMTKSFKENTISTELMQGENIMERISREVRQANSIYSISVNDLKLNTKDTIGTAKTIEFVLSGSDIRLLENNVFTANLNTANISVQGLTFTQITTTKGVAVKMVLTIKSTHDSLNRTQNFYDTVVLRGDY
jgi:hypothetical protein